jgi:AraC-like DNA-binding protein
VRHATFEERRRLYLLARVLVKRHYRRELTVGTVARALACSPRQLQRAYAQFGSTFHEDLRQRRLAAAAELLAAQPLPVEDVARLTGYSEGSHLARAFRRCYGVTPASFRERARNRP